MVPLQSSLAGPRDEGDYFDDYIYIYDNEVDADDDEDIHYDYRKDDVFAVITC